MRVLICPDDCNDATSHRQVGVELPTYQEALKDALQKAGVSKGEPYYLSYTESWPPFLYPRLQVCEATLEEANLLAFKLSKLDAVELEQYEAIMDSMQVKSMKDIINVSYSLRNFVFLPGLMDVTELGETAISNDLADILMDLPDEVFPLLSPEKVGEYMTV